MSRLSNILTYIFYPISLLSVLGIAALAIKYHWDYQTTLGLTALFITVVLVVAEAVAPLRQQWRMTRQYFWGRDIKYLILGFALNSGAKTLMLWSLLSLGVATENGLLADIPIVPGVILAILIMDLVQYWLHRWSHEAKGMLGRFLWRVHFAHHMPEQVYVLMHPVHHPLTIIFLSGVVLLPISALGFSSEVILIFGLIMLLQGQFSHFNMNIRAGLFNYILTGTELHRYHHSANTAEAKNYGSITPIWDLVFGTFHYRPGHLPDSLGLADAKLYPRVENVWSVIKFPFRMEKKLAAKADVKGL